MRNQKPLFTLAPETSRIADWRKFQRHWFVKSQRYKKPSVPPLTKQPKSSPGQKRLFE